MKVVTKKKSSESPTEAGISMTEFAIVLPVFVLFLFGVMQFGLIFSTQLALRNAASVAARAVALGDPDNRPTLAAQEVIIDNAAKGATAGVLALENDDIDVYPATVGGESATRIVISYDLNLILPLVVPGQVDGKLSLSSEATVR